MGEPTVARYPTSTPNLTANRVNQKTFVVSGTHTAIVQTITTSATIAGITAPCYLVNATTGEIIYAEGISGATFTTCTRGADGSTAQPMATGQILHAILVANDINQIIREVLAIAANNADPMQIHAIATNEAIRFASSGTGNIPDLSATYAVAAKGVTNGDTHDHSGGDGAQIDHTGLSNIGTNAHSTIDSFISSKAAASGLASLDGSSKVVQDPANATATPTAGKIPIADGAGKLDGWVTAGAYTLTYADILAVQVFS